MTITWEYHAFNPGGPLIHPHDIRQWLSSYGRDGWELVLRDDHGNWVFKRPAAETVPADAHKRLIPVSPGRVAIKRDEATAEIVARRQGVRIK